MSKNFLTNKKLERIARVTFDSVDKDGSGLIDIKELEVVMNSIANDLGLTPPSKKEIKECFDLLDTDRSGNINYEEFKFLIKSVLEFIM